MFNSSCVTENESGSSSNRTATSDGNGKKRLRRKLHLVPAQVAHVAAAPLRVAVIHGQIKAAALRHQGNADVIEEHFAIVQTQSAHHHFEDCARAGACRSG